MSVLLDACVLWLLRLWCACVCVGEGEWLSESYAVVRAWMGGETGDPTGFGNLGCPDVMNELVVQHLK